MKKTGRCGWEGQENGRIRWSLPLDDTGSLRDSGRGGPPPPPPSLSALVHVRRVVARLDCVACGSRRGRAAPARGPPGGGPVSGRAPGGRAGDAPRPEPPASPPQPTTLFRLYSRPNGKICSSLPLRTLPSPPAPFSRCIFPYPQRPVMSHPTFTHCRVWCPHERLPTIAVISPETTLFAFQSFSHIGYRQPPEEARTPPPTRFDHPTRAGYEQMYMYFYIFDKRLSVILS
ncbi:hypothetical protein AAG570_008722 [Ranatra chinensis]|uniref:Uncharacterized protein n=1 Tax=Ranatra chinensis TaxID=642074 RepID=A0ABD0YRP9_9HEMI